MLVIDYRSKTAIYEQIKTQIMELIAVGTLKPHDQLPSIRSLASQLELNFNTVKKAFGELESGERVLCGGKRPGEPDSAPAGGRGPAGGGGVRPGRGAYMGGGRGRPERGIRPANAGRKAGKG